MAVNATDENMTSDIRIPPDERKDIEDKSLSHKLGRAIKTAIMVSIWDEDRLAHDKLLGNEVPEKTVTKLSWSDMV